MKRRAIVAITGAALLALALAVSGQAASSAGGLTVKADAKGKLRYHPTKLSAKAGKVTITMINPKSSGSKHGIAVKGNGINSKGKIVKAGKNSALTVTLKPGTYTFYCNFDQHLKLGMKGTLTVK